MYEQFPVNQNLDTDSRWREYLESAITYWMESLPIETQNELDYSSNSLDTVEEWLFEQYKERFDVFDALDYRQVEGAEFYIGEVYRRHLGGYWMFNTASEDDLRELQLCITGHHKKESLYLLWYVVEHVETGLPLRQHFNILRERLQESKSSPQ